MFSCRKLDTEGTGAFALHNTERWHSYDYSINCDDAGYRFWENLASCMFVVYPLGIPALSLWIFRKNANRLKDTSSQLSGVELVEKDSPDASPFAEAWRMPQEKRKVPWWYGDRSTFFFMVRDYQPQYYYFEIVEFARKLALTGLLMFFEAKSVIQIFTGITVAFGFASLNAVVRPYADDRANTMRLTADASLFFTLLCINILHFEEHISPCDWLQPRKIGWFLILINFFLLFCILLSELASRMCKMYNDAAFVGISYLPDEPLDLEMDPQFSTGLVQKTGSGSSVYRGRYKASTNTTPVPCAVKIRPRMADNRVLSIEASIMLKCNHANIVRIYHTEEDASKYYLCTELCEQSIEIAIQLGKLGDIDARIQLCKAMVEGVQAFHDAGFVHGNLTPANFLVEEGVPRLCGFSSAVWFNESAMGTKLDTMGGTIGYMPAEVIAGRKLHVVVEVINPVAVDIFSLGATLCYVFSNGQKPFRANLAAGTIERNIVTGSHGVDDIGSLPPEAKHLLAGMLDVSPAARSRHTPASILQHPLFWPLEEKVQFLGEDIGSTLPVRIHKTKHPFIRDLEEAMDEALGTYDETHPKGGDGSWARRFDSRYPLTGDWGKSQRAPEDEERFYHIYGAPPSKKQAAEREKQVAAGKVQGSHKAKEIRSVGLLKFIRNVYVHRAQMVDMGRFESEEAVLHYLLDPFPWLLTVVHTLDTKHGMSTGGMQEASAEARASVQEEKPPSAAQRTRSLPSLPLHTEPSESTSNPVAGAVAPPGAPPPAPEGEPAWGGMTVGDGGSGSVTAL
eukprot:COSAG04_NODE_1019_length_8734_cov_2.287319_2_plen_793_part_00